jgi:NAD(P)-dependent dehydrogenase (short-subunit alcohol dehydrogenase family)
MTKTILVTGAGSGFAEAAAIGMAQAGHTVIATAQISPQVAALRNKVAELGLDNIRVEKLDLLDPYDVAYIQTFDIDVLWNNAGYGESGPVSEVPLDLVRRNFEVNVFKPLELTQGFIAKWVKQAKIVFTSSMAGLTTFNGLGTYASTKHALEAVAEAIAQEVAPFGIKVQTINPGPYLTGFNEMMAETGCRWLDDAKNFTKPGDFRAYTERMLSTPEGRLDPQEMIDIMISVIPAETGKFRNVSPQAVEDLIKDMQAAAWTAEI